MHRMKGQNQVLNGPKDVIKEEEFDSWRTQAHQAYSNPPITASGMADPYMSNYYAATTPAAMTFPYVNQTLGDGPWSNGRDPMAQFLGAGGGGDSHHYMESMFGQNSFNSYNQAYNYFPGNAGGDYTTWGTPRKPTTPYEEYYRETYDQGIDRNSLKHIDQSMSGLSLADHKPDIAAQFSKEAYAKYTAATHPVNISVTPSQDHQMVKKYTTVNSDSITNPSLGAKQLSWASVASQPAKPQTKFNKAKTLNNNSSSTSVPSPSNKQNSSNMDIGTWENKNGTAGNITNSSSSSNKVNTSPTQPSWNSNNSGQRTSSNNYDSHLPSSNQPLPSPSQESSLGSFPSHPILDKLRKDNEYNPKEFDTNPKGARFFIIKSYSEDDIHRSIKYSIWCSTEHGNKRLDQAFREREGKGPIYLLFSVNGSGHFCGVAQMASPVDYNSSSNIWAQDKWRGQFKVKWIFVKDVPNTQLRHIRLENNDNKPVTNSRDTQEVPLEKGKRVLQIFHQYNHHTSIFDDFLHYEKRQQEDEQRKTQGKSIPLKNDN